MTPEVATVAVKAAVNTFDIRLVFIVIGTGLTTVGLIYTVIRNFRKDLKADREKFEAAVQAQDERIFQLATGKTLKEAMLEAKKKAEGQ